MFQLFTHYTSAVKALPYSRTSYGGAIIVGGAMLAVVDRISRLHARDETSPLATVLSGGGGTGSAAVGAGTEAGPASALSIDVHAPTTAQAAYAPCFKPLCGTVTLHTRMSQVLVPTPALAAARAAVLDYAAALASARPLVDAVDFYDVASPSLQCVRHLLALTGRGATELPPHTIRVGAYSYMAPTDPEVLLRWFLHDWADVPEWQVYRDCTLLFRVRRIACWCVQPCVLRGRSLSSHHRNCMAMSRSWLTRTRSSVS